MLGVSPNTNLKIISREIIPTYVITIHERDRRTDGRDAQAAYCGITALCIAPRGKNHTGQNATVLLFVSKEDDSFANTLQEREMLHRNVTKCWHKATNSDVVGYSSPAVYSSPTRVLILRTLTWTRTKWTRLHHWSVF